MAYTKQNFQDGQKLTAEQLNHMEEGLYAASVEISNTNTAVENMQSSFSKAQEDITELENILQISSVVYDYQTILGFEMALIDLNGVPQATGAWRCSDYISVNKGDLIKYKLTGYPHVSAIAFYDKYKKFISSIAAASEPTLENQYNAAGEVTVAEDCAYIRFSGFHDTVNDPPLFTEQNVVIETNIFSKLEQDADNDDFLTTTEHYDYSALSAFKTKAYIDLNGVSQLTSSWRCSDYISISENDTLSLYLAAYNTVSAIAFYDINHNFIGNIVSNENWGGNKNNPYTLTGDYKVPANVAFMRVSVFFNDNAGEQYITIKKNTINNIKTNIDIINGLPLNILVLGDSYSGMGYWIESMGEIIPVKNVVNLGVTSATIKDKYADRTQYPYTDKPGGDGGNLNTLACQIQKLKRLMLGNDLLDGEVKLYEDVAEYPNVIIIEGGMNDWYDSEEAEATYQNQFLVEKTAYFKQSSAATATERTVYVKPTLEEIDRTCFAGAYRYLCEELITLFPNAQIFITTASHMNYFTTNPNTQYGKIAEQQRKCADIMSYAVIDWHAEGNLNTMMIGLKGSGTIDDPYTPAGGDEYTTDLLHPNSKGAKRYGRLAGKVIKQKYLGLS